MHGNNMYPNYVPSRSTVISEGYLISTGVRTAASKVDRSRDDFYGNIMFGNVNIFLVGDKAFGAYKVNFS